VQTENSKYMLINYRPHGRKIANYDVRRENNTNRNCCAQGCWSTSPSAFYYFGHAEFIYLQIDAIVLFIKLKLALGFCVPG